MCRSRGLAWDPKLFGLTVMLISGRDLAPARPPAEADGTGGGAGLGTREVGMSHMLWHSSGRQAAKALESQVSASLLWLVGREGRGGEEDWAARPLLRPMASLSEPVPWLCVSELFWHSEPEISERSWHSGLLGRSVLGVLCGEYCAWQSNELVSSPSHCSQLASSSWHAKIASPSSTSKPSTTSSRPTTFCIPLELVSGSAWCCPPASRAARRNFPAKTEAIFVAPFEEALEARVVAEAIFPAIVLAFWLPGSSILLLRERPNSASSRPELSHSPLCGCG